ncbi:TIGR04348 family glycosyltransferase [Candidatus Poribacteria bacterium]|nr:TIGR04348 family glycosyltransferase [Candidatus Poribacteria bacterium]MBT5709877.1 TIGR04348 family glycosyltransferase [Candidatus Poribacteria bacterium]MBT7099258.1 TIGR04348 family glycosyltransferase [Candidatus Poribacteria bacterium]MBT7804539.1 TIGR04348 family glycosyltransferase [Candidatus Poribacteria bacterium]
MNIRLITPAPSHSRKGNRVTALRWARLLRELGHGVTVELEYDRARPDVMVALHARRSHASMRRFRERYPSRPLILALTGTDLYSDIHTDADAQESLELADLYVVLQPAGIDELPERLRGKARVIYQSVTPPRGDVKPIGSAFEVAVIGHLRPVKDPFRTADASHLLPPESRIAITHVGGALSPDMEERALAETASNPRYRWLGELPRWRAMRVLARSRCLSLTSVSEGGANVVSEALACGTPVVSSRITGSSGLLGDDYAGYFPVGDTEALADMLRRVETDEAFVTGLREQCARRRGVVEPDRERESWAQLLAEFAA